MAQAHQLGRYQCDRWHGVHLGSQNESVAHDAQAQSKFRFLLSDFHCQQLLLMLIEQHWSTGCGEIVVSTGYNGACLVFGTA